jgi:hypothetical protein
MSRTAGARRTIPPPAAGVGRTAARIHAGIEPVEVARRLAPSLHWPGAHSVAERSWRLVARTAQFDAWLIAWPEGGKVDLHDHGNVGGAISVIAGSLVEAVPWRDDAGRLSLERSVLPAGATLGFGPGHVHDVTNESSGHALSLHVYSPALSSMNFFDLVGDRLVRRAVRWAADGAEHVLAAEASGPGRVGEQAAR